MKNRYLLIPAIGLYAVAPASAQDRTVSNAVKGTMTQTTISPPPPPPVYIPPPALPAAPLPSPPPPVPYETTTEVAKPPISVAPSRPRYPRDPRLTNYREGLPTQADYPISSWRNDSEGTVRYSVDVDADGKPTDCIIVSSSGDAALDAKTCEVIMERAEFSPALEDADTPVSGSLTRSYRWRKREPEMPTMSVTFRYLHDTDGSSKECELLKLEGDVPERIRKDIERDMVDGTGCPRGVARRGVPYRDEDGVPVAKRVTVSFDVKVEEPGE